MLASTWKPNRLKVRRRPEKRPKKSKMKTQFPKKKRKKKIPSATGTAGSAAFSKIPTNGRLIEPASVYFHIPFCSRKCPYCHFYVLPDEERFKTQLISALALEWKKQAPLLAGKDLISLYFGGGTPFLFGPDAIKTIIEWVNPPKHAEITLEANPENVTLELMQAYKKAGINRVSIGVQSLDDSSLNTLERTHNAAAAIRAIELTKEAGIDNISIDLMYDLPSQTLESWERTLDRLEHLPITHLSLYNLTFEPHTVFFKHRKKLTPLVPTPDLSLKMLETAVQRLEALGLARYEISAFAKPGYASKHNSGYWTARPFLGFGPSAFSYWEGKRFRNIANLSAYAKALAAGDSPVDFSETLAHPDNLHELLAVRLRLLEGVDLAQFPPLPPATHAILHSLATQGWLELQPAHVKLSQEGLLFYDSVATAII